jgi:hypothetical protein
MVSDAVSYVAAVVALLVMIAPWVYAGALVFRVSGAFSKTLNAYCRSRMAWAWGCLFALAVALVDLSYLVIGRRLPSALTGIPYYILIIALAAGVILHKRAVRKQLKQIQQYSR